MVAVTGMHLRSLSGVLALALFAYGCSGSDSSGPPPSETLLIQSGNNQSALAGTALPAPIVIALQDPSGSTIVGQTATFTVVAGGGFLANSTGQTNADGTITAPTWTIGKGDVPQQMQAVVDGKTTVVDAAVQTAYKIEVRFYGPSLTTAQQALFTNAAARVRAIIVGQLPLVNVAGADVSPCTGTTIAPLTGTVDGLLIYAALDSIDGPRKTVAHAGPCYIRLDQNGAPDYRTAVGVMEFDSADIALLTAQGALENTITHEMLHILGFGAFWDDKNLIVTSDTATAKYVGPGGIAGCQAVGGTVTCASSVPIENCVGVPDCGAGSIFSHWEESTFKTEMMTPFINIGPNPLSAMTIRSLEDLGYTVNPAGADAYTIAIGSSMLAGDASSSPAASGVWERRLPVRPRTLPTIVANSGSGK